MSPGMAASPVRPVRKEAHRYSDWEVESTYRGSLALGHHVMFIEVRLCGN